MDSLEKAIVTIRLSPEIIHMICGLLTDKKDLKNVRLASRSFNVSAESYLFRSIHLTVSFNASEHYTYENKMGIRWEISTTNYWPKSLNIFESEVLHKHVRELIFTPMFNHTDPNVPCRLQFYNFAKKLLSKLESVRDVHFTSGFMGFAGNHIPAWHFVIAALINLPRLRSLVTVGGGSWGWLQRPEGFTDAEKQTLSGLHKLKFETDMVPGRTSTSVLDYTRNLRSLAICNSRFKICNLTSGTLTITSKLPCLTYLSLSSLEMSEENLQTFLLSVAPTLRVLQLEDMAIGDRIEEQVGYERRCPWLSIFYLLGESMQLDEVDFRGYFISERWGWNVTDEPLNVLDLYQRQMDEDEEEIDEDEAGYANYDPFDMHCRLEKYVTKGSPFPLPAPDTDITGINREYVSDGSFEAHEDHQFLLNG
ncbi:hypothetical protein NHQ30_009284 [Ciborinia camelliae]|nr:hypothetical protein NHQ30_009284 [Ciborinia camelliae]